MEIILWIVGIAFVLGAPIAFVLLLSRSEKNRKAAFLSAIHDLGLREDPRERSQSWRTRFYGTAWGTSIVIGEVEHVRATKSGPTRSVWIEIGVTLLSDLGKWHIQNRTLCGTPDVRSPGRTDILEFDRHFVVSTDPPVPAHSIVSLPWLNLGAQKLFLRSPELQELRIEGRYAAVLLRWYEPQSLKNAVDLVAMLAAWSAGNSTTSQRSRS